MITPVLSNFNFSLPTVANSSTKISYFDDRFLPLENYSFPWNNIKKGTLYIKSLPVEINGDYTINLNNIASREGSNNIFGAPLKFAISLQNRSYPSLSTVYFGVPLSGVISKTVTDGGVSTSYTTAISTFFGGQITNTGVSQSTVLTGTSGEFSIAVPEFDNYGYSLTLSNLSAGDIIDFYVQIPYADEYRRPVFNISADVTPASNFVPSSPTPTPTITPTNTPTVTPSYTQPTTPTITPTTTPTPSPTTPILLDARKFAVQLFPPYAVRECFFPLLSAGMNNPVKFDGRPAFVFRLGDFTRKALYRLNFNLYGRTPADIKILNISYNEIETYTFTLSPSAGNKVFMTDPAVRSQVGVTNAGVPAVLQDFSGKFSYTPYSSNTFSNNPNTLKTIRDGNFSNTASAAIYGGVMSYGVAVTAYDILNKNNNGTYIVISPHELTLNGVCVLEAQLLNTILQSTSSVGLTSVPLTAVPIVTKTSTPTPTTTQTPTRTPKTTPTPTPTQSSPRNNSLSGSFVNLITKTPTPTTTPTKTPTKTPVKSPTPTPTVTSSRPRSTPTPTPTSTRFLTLSSSLSIEQILRQGRITDPSVSFNVINLLKRLFPRNKW